MSSVNGSGYFVLGGNGQLGSALKKIYPEAKFVDRDEFDMAEFSNYAKIDWSAYSTIINAAAYTAVDDAETVEGRRISWSVNATAVSFLATVANKYHLKLVHISSDYVFDGAIKEHDESEPFSPLGVYGQTKAAGDIAASICEKHYILRTSWVIGEGKNFVRTMKSLSDKGISPSVVSDQLGRLTFTEDLALAIQFLLEKNAPYGTYNMTNTGAPASWAEIATEVYKLCGNKNNEVIPVTTDEYYKGKENISPRPLNSFLKLDKIERLGFSAPDWRNRLKEYILALR